MPVICRICEGVCILNVDNAKSGVHLEPMVRLPVHLKLVEGLAYHVGRGEMEAAIAVTIVRYYDENHPFNNALDEAVLWVIRKEWGLSCPAR